MSRNSNMLSPSYPYAKNGFAARHGSMLDYSRDGGNGLIDLVPANNAYSLRYLSDEYTGPVVRIRRDNDNAEANFTPDEILDTTLTTWVGANEGHVVTWFDQSGNGYDATQSTANAQPKLVTGGNVIMFNGLPSVRNSVSANIVNLSTGSGVFSLSMPNQLFMVAAHNTGTGASEYPLGGTTSVGQNAILKSNVGQQLKLYGGGFTIGVDAVGTNQWLMNALFDGNAPVGFRHEFRLNGSTKSSGGGVGSYPLDGTRIFNAFDPSLVNWLGYIQEVIVFDGDVSGENDLIEGNVNDYYSIY